MIKRNLERFAILFVMLAVAGIAAHAGEPVAKQGNGWREDVDGIRVVHLSGSPHDIGFQHGTLLKPEINFLLNYFIVEESKFFGAGVDVMQRNAPRLEKFIPADMIEEMKGIAEGAGVPYEHVLWANTFLDVVSAIWSGVAPNCSNFAVMGSHSGTGHIVHGRNLDWTANEQLAAANTVFVITPDEGISFVSLSWPGMAGTLTGMNAQQISMGEMTSISDEATMDGTPFMIHLRILLQQAHTLDEAYQILNTLPRTTGYNALVTDGKTDDGFVAEMSAGHIFRKGPENGMLIRTNHYHHPGMQKTQKKVHALLGKEKTMESFYRFDRLTELLTTNDGKVNPELAMSFLSDKINPKTGEISEDYTNTIYKSNTLQSVVMLPQTQEMYLALKTMPAPEGGYVHIQFDLPAAAEEKE
jgi:predicted choloylglycine hydrolase